MYCELMNERKYIPPTLTVDGVIFQLIDSSLNVLLIQRSREPFKNYWALPGGYCAAGEKTVGALNKILIKKTGLTNKDIGLIEQLYTFDTIANDPRGYAVSVAYMGLGKDLEFKNTETTQKPTFYPINALPKLAFKHLEIIEYAHERLKAKLTYTNTVFALLPELFTLSKLQTAYEAILGRELDKRNFRKKFLSLELIEDSGKKLQDGAHRPARLFKFNSPRLQVLVRSLD